MSHPTAHVIRTAQPSLYVMLALWLHRCALSIERAAVDAVRSLVERRRDDRGQATTEYALVLLAAALVALLVVAWATAGGGAAKISRLFNRVIDSVVDRV
ncbi:MAG: DUF4244 domain-containing protein [Ilumatobacter sp.]|jgi:Flp pilus assembly pilin Flp|uniref:DUF4244 domain-containing protein n=1 Tax=Ilumatobacter sp. TaxID=1967498 RepID=UPI00391A64CE